MCDSSNQDYSRRPGLAQLCFVAALMLGLIACNEEPSNIVVGENPPVLVPGEWLLELDCDGATLPVGLNVRHESGLQVDFINASETITAYEYLSENDSLRIRMPLFDSEFVGVVSDDRKQYSGVWINYWREGNYQLPFTASFGEEERFCPLSESAGHPVFTEALEVRFSPDTEDEYPAVGLLQQDENSNRITGTFLTETGDYRFLEGSQCGNSIKLSCFDGSHAFLFEGELSADGVSEGVFISGKHWQENWTASVNPEFSLRDPSSITQVNDTSLFWTSVVKDAQGVSHSLSDLRQDGRVLIIQALGTWCPNCVDESRELVELHERLNDKGLDIVSVAFENCKEGVDPFRYINEYKKDLDIPYDIYLGGSASKSEAGEVLQGINALASFPTAFIVDRSGQIREVHTGFYGPGTGQYYELWKHDNEMLLDKLLNE